MLLSVSFEIDEVRSETLFRKPSSYLHRLQCPSWHIKFLICFYRTFFNTGNPFDFSEKQPLVNVIWQSCSGKWKFNMETSSTWLRWDSITSVFLWILWLQTLYCFQALVQWWLNFIFRILNDNINGLRAKYW